jgi:Cu(I)/Ag(I) efflux system membrane fusion protein
MHIAASLRYVLVACAAAGLGAGAYKYWSERHAGHAPVSQSAPAAQSAVQADRKVLYWYDPMVPQQRFEKPGKSPFMDMDLVPKYADEMPQAGSVSIDPRMAQNLGLRLASVERADLAAVVEAVGIVQPDETRVVTLQARVGGFIERQPVRALNQPVAKGQVLLELTSPELIAAQEELLLALNAGDNALAHAARMRLSLFGLSDDQIERVAQTREVQRRIPLLAPESGIVTELSARPGMAVMPGAALMTLTSLARVWVIVDVPESLAGRIAPGRKAEIRFSALPGASYSGQVEFLYPEIRGETRTLRARVPLDNPRGALKPGMLAQVSVAGGEASAGLWVPSEAVIETGQRTVVIVAAKAGGFRPVEVTRGRERGGRSEILSGLSAGQKVVASGQFLIDSEASLNSALSRMEAPQSDAPKAQAAEEHDQAHAGHAHEHPPQRAAADCPPHGAPSHDHDRHHAVDCAPAAASAAEPVSGRVDAVDLAAGKVKLTHGPIAALGMPAMTMNFRAEKPEALRALRAGQEVEFVVERRGSDYVVTRIAPKAR